jgi:IclR family pca regulon transcriptional regulator
MGRVLLAGLDDEELDERISRMQIRPLTSHTVASERALRDALAVVRKQGYAMVDQELEEGLRSAAVPIHGADGTVTASLNVSVHASRASMAVLRREFLPHALEAAAAIEEDLRGSRLRGAPGGSLSA